MIRKDQRHVATWYSDYNSPLQELMVIAEVIRLSKMDQYTKNALYNWRNIFNLKIPVWIKILQLTGNSA